MKRIDNRGPVGIVLYTRNDSSNDRAGPQQNKAASAHLVLNRFKVDDDGRICLTPDLALDELRGAVDVFKAQLDALLDDVSERPMAR
jgi:hypothetical protein